jgi:hypothetical protein
MMCTRFERMETYALPTELKHLKVASGLQYRF